MLHELLPLLIRNLDRTQAPICNNASWAIGEVAVRVDPSCLQPYVLELMDRLVTIINDDTGGTQAIAGSACITIGRIGCVW
jgi:transportin-1